MARVDAVIVGSGPNGLAAAIAIAQTGRKVIVFEAAETRNAAAYRPLFEPLVESWAKIIEHLQSAQW